jgi:hypothetical protein
VEKEHLKEADDTLWTVCTCILRETKQKYHASHIPCFAPETQSEREQDKTPGNSG